jgi:hemerythrin
LSEIGYPEEAEHSSIHNDLIYKAMNLKESFAKNDVRPSAFFSFIVDDVITGHMVSEDAKYFPYLSKKLD